MSFQRLPVRDGDEGAPDETTSIATARDNAADYQSTRMSPNPRNRRPAQQADADHQATNGTNHYPEEEKSWLKNCLDSIWSIELENKGSVARDHLALGMFNCLSSLCLHSHAAG